ncbi:MAG: hypothetical protein JW909_03890 [Planctomycetes bacterium]|nr:hypothetical protein [Planctomycetota bacterium]
MKKMLLLFAFGVMLLAPAVSAQENYKLAQGLSRIGLNELAIFLMENNKSGRGGAEAKAGMGVAYVQLAENEKNADKKRDYYAKAKDYLTQATRELGENHPLYGEVAGALGELDLAKARANMKQLKAITDVEKKAEFMAEARAIFLDVVKKFKTSYDGAMKEYLDTKKRVEEEDKVTVKRERLEEKLKTALEKAVTAGQRYFKACFEAVDSYEDNSADKRSFVSKVTEEADAFIKVFDEYLLITSWGHFAKGFMQMKGEDFENATGSFDLVIDIDMAEIPKIYHEFINGIREPAFYYKADCQLKARRYRDAEGTCSGYMMEYRGRLNENWGQAVINVLAEAQWAQKNYKQAVQTLKKGIDLHGTWEYNYRELLAKWYKWCEENKPDLVRFFDDAATMYAAAQGEYQAGKYRDAVRGYRRAVMACRRPETDRLMKLKVEPQAWYEMGLSYYKMDRLPEAALSWSEVVLGFADKFLTEKDKRNEEVYGKTKETVEKAKKNMLAASNKIYKLEKNRAARDIVGWAQTILMKVDPDAKDKFQIDMAESKLEEIKITKNPQKRRDIIEEAFQMFTDVKHTTKYYDRSRWKRGYCRYKQIDEYTREWERVIQKPIPSEVLDTMRKLADEMDRCFDEFEQYVKANPTFDPAINKSRETYRITTPILRVIAHYSVQDYDGTIRIAVQNADRITLEDANYPTYYWFYFKALIEKAKLQAEQKMLKEAAAQLNAAGSLVDVMNKHKDKALYYTAMCGQVGSSYRILAKMAADDAAANEYKAQSAIWIRKTMPANPTPQFLVVLGTNFFKLGMYEDALELFDKLLNDPQNGLDPDRNNITTDIPENIFADLRKRSFDDEKATRELRKAIDQLKEVTIVPETVDYARATVLLDAIDKLMPDHPDKEVFKTIRSEIENRKIILSARTKTIECYVELAKAAAAANNKEEASGMYEKAEKDSLALLEFWPNDRDIMYTLGEIRFALGKFTEASHNFHISQKFFKEGSPEWIRANKRIVECASEAALKKGDKPEDVQVATGYLLTIIQGVPKSDLEAVWPDFAKVLQSFVDRGGVIPEVELPAGVDLVPWSKNDAELRAAIQTTTIYLTQRNVPPDEARKILTDKVHDMLRARIVGKTSAIKANINKKIITTKEEADLWYRKELLTFLTAPCVEKDVLKKQVAETGALTAEQMQSGIPVELWPPDERKMIEDFGYVDKDGKITVPDVDAEYKEIAGALSKFGTSTGEDNE